LLFCHCSHYHPNIIDVTDSYCGINFDCKIKKMFNHIWRPLYLVFYHLLSPSVSVGSLTQSLNLWVWQVFYQFTLPFTPCKNWWWQPQAFSKLGQSIMIATHCLGSRDCTIKWVPLFKLSLLLNNYLKDTQTLQLN
jgi:hypothetical protein